MAARKKRHRENKVNVENEDIDNAFYLGDPEQLAEKLYDVLIQCYIEAARCEEGEYLAAVMVLERGAVSRIEVRKWNSLETPLPDNELFMAVLEGFGPVTGEIEKHARNWAEAVIIGLEHAFESVGLMLDSSFEDDLFWDDDFDEPEAIAPKSKRRRKGERN
ncbi:MAG TPA: hypothetical protein GX517_03880 [Alicyclobacillus sp.]|nr:hypothetical protein [Alicyclobacillus sp.]